MTDTTPLDLDVIRAEWANAGELEQREWALDHADALIAEIERLRDWRRGVETMHWPEEAHRQHDRAYTAEAEVERLRVGVAHIVDRYGSAPGIETCATMYDLRRLAEEATS